MTHFHTPASTRAQIPVSAKLQMTASWAFRVTYRVKTTNAKSLLKVLVGGSRRGINEKQTPISMESHGACAKHPTNALLSSHLQEVLGFSCFSLISLPFPANWYGGKTCWFSSTTAITLKLSSSGLGDSLTFLQITEGEGIVAPWEAGGDTHRLSPTGWDCILVGYAELR